MVLPTLENEQGIKSIKRINYAYKTLAIVSVAKWRVVQLPGELQRQVTAEADAKDIAQQKQGQVVIGRGFALERAFLPIEALKGGKEVFHRIAGSRSKCRAR